MKTIKLLIIDEFGEIEKALQTIKKESVQQLINIAEKNNLKCLSFVDITGDTYFNEMQVAEIKNKELPILENDPTLDKNLLAMLNNATNIILNRDFLYLKFEDQD